MVTESDEYSLACLRLGIDTHQEPIIYMRSDCHVCRSEGFTANSRILVRVGGRSIIASLNVVYDDLVPPGAAGFSEPAWSALDPAPGNRATFTVGSMSDVRRKIYGHALTNGQFNGIIEDIAAGLYTDIELAAFVAGCSGTRLSRGEMISLTRAMVDAGKVLRWGNTHVLDKHCIGGLPGNRTTPIVVAIVASRGLMIPKTSSRAITSPAGTADTMETMAPVALSLSEMRRVADREGGCVVWGGNVELSPVDDILIRIERALDIDSPGQLVASVLSKKAAAGSTHVVVDIPVGPTAKVREIESADWLAGSLTAVGRAVGLSVHPVVTGGLQPVGRGIGPALEALDVLAVLQGNPAAPEDLRTRSVALAGAILDMMGCVAGTTGESVARETLASGEAWKKFQAICDAQGGIRSPPRAPLVHSVDSQRAGRVDAIDVRRLSRAAKLAGAPAVPAAGLTLEARLESVIESGDPLFTIHAQTRGELDYALEYVAANPDIYRIRG